MPEVIATAGPVLVEQREAVLVITFNRPERLNAWTDELETAYFDVLEQADDDPSVRAIVVTGAGRGFCAGADMDDLQVAATEDAMRLARPRHYPQTVRKPLVAAINGAAAGLGLVEALFCDIRFSAPEAKLTTAFARRGLIAEYGMAWTLSRLVGPGRALDLLLSGRVLLGEEAYAIGLVDRLVPAGRVLDEAVGYAQELADTCSPASMAVIKRQVYDELHCSYDEALAGSQRLMVESFQRPDSAEGVASYLERRPPRFPPLPSRGERTPGSANG